LEYQVSATQQFASEDLDVNPQEYLTIENPFGPGTFTYPVLGSGADLLKAQVSVVSLEDNRVVFDSASSANVGRFFGLAER
jgi:hypothetical protein